MRIIILLLVSSFLFLHSCEQAPADPNTENATAPQESITTETRKLLRHVVLFNFTEATPPDTIEIIEQAFAALPDKIDEIHAFEWGTNNSPEGLDKGHTHCFLVTFLSEEDRDAYLPHPAHQEFVALVGPYIEDVTVVDYWAQ